MKLSRWLCVFLLYITCQLSAQEPYFVFHDIGEANASADILCMVQDHSGMIWLGTENGLARYTGVAWQNITLPGAAYPEAITAMMEDHLHRLWIGTASGTLYFRDAYGYFHLFDIEEGSPKKKITSIVEDKQGLIWFATYGEGVYIYTGKRLFNINDRDTLAGNDIYAMALGPENAVWVGTDDGISVCRFYQETEVKEITHIGPAEGLPDQIVTSLKADGHGNMFIGTFEKGIVYYDSVLRTISDPFALTRFSVVTSIGLFDEKEVWMGTLDKGVWRASGKDKRFQRITSLDRINIEFINALLFDVEGNMWIAPKGGGLISCFRPFEILMAGEGEIQALFCDHANQLWIGKNDGLYKLVTDDGNGNSVKRIAPPILSISSIIEDHFQQLWIATLDKGLYVYDPVKSKIHPIPSIFKKGNLPIMSLAVSDSLIWIATLEGVISYPTSKNILLDAEKIFELLRNGTSSQHQIVYNVFVDSKDVTWLATEGHGVMEVNKGNISFHVGNDSVQLRTVYSIAEDHNGHMWFNCPDIGLVEYDRNNYRPLGLGEGLSNLRIESILSSGTGDLLMTHERGIDVMEPDRRHFMYYDNEIGAINSAPALNAITADSDRHVYMGFKDQIYKYYAVDHKLSIHPNTQIVRVAVFDEDVDIRNANRFSHAQDYFTFEYIGLWYTSPASVTYEYMLEGYDRQWKQSKDNIASYAHLSPGDYTFYVRASENRDFLDEPTTSYSFTIQKPFYLEYAFIWVIAITAGALLYWLIKSREKRSERQVLLKKEMVESQLSAIKAQINPHFLFNSFNTLITIIDENTRNPEIAIEYVEKLSDFYRSILQYREQESISLEEEFDVVRNFGYLLEKRYGHYLRLHLDKPPADGLILPLTLQILVENAVKHNVISDKHPLDVYITADPDGYVTVKNNLRPKATAEPSTQFGLQSIIKQYQLLSDKKVIINEGTHTFEVRIPIIKRSFE